jgi:hypothetical protein
MPCYYLKKFLQAISPKKKIWPIKAVLSPHMLSGKIHSFHGYNNKEEVVLKTNEVNK